jgi:hypothetical protein
MEKRVIEKDVGVRLSFEEVESWLQNPEDAELRRAFLDWFSADSPNSRREEIPEAVRLNEAEAMLVKQVVEWTRELCEKGREAGRQEGEAHMLLRMLETRFGPLDERTRTRVLSAGAERLMKWGERFVFAERLTDVFGD